MRGKLFFAWLLDMDSFQKYSFIILPFKDNLEFTLVSNK